MSATPDYTLATRWFLQNHTWLCARAGNFMGNTCHGEDIASETFLRILKLPDLSSVREPRAFLVTIAKRLILDNWRREDLERTYLETLATEPANTLHDPEEHAILLETICRLDYLLDGLPAKAKTAFIYSQFGGQTYEQIARRLGVSRSRVFQYMEQAFLCCLEALTDER